MHTRLVVSCAVLLFLSLAAWNSSASGQPRIVDVKCDTLSMVPLVVEISFGVHNDHEFRLAEIVMFPSGSSSAPRDSCVPSGCSSPAGWACHVAAGTIGQATVFYPLTDADFMEPGETKYFYAIRPRPTGCCYDVGYHHPAIPEPFHGELICFDCDMPVQTQGSTWGRMKVLYR